MILDLTKTWIEFPMDLNNNLAESDEVTALLLRWREPTAREELFSILYPALKRVAAIRMQHERFDHTLQPTALVGEVYLHLVRQNLVTWKNRAHFLAIASEAMRRILVDYARAKNSDKRGSGSILISATNLELGKPGDPLIEVLAIDQILARLALKDSRAAQVVQLRYFGGLNFEEIAEVLTVTARTAKRDWQLARAWLFTELVSES
jgi:RNA polymerase sigma factor (TIGR02999 family)